MTQALQGAALVCVVLGLVSSLAVAGRARRVQPPLAVLLDFLLAAGLLRLSAAASATAIATAAVIIAVRKLAVIGIGQHARPAGRQRQARRDP